MPSGSDAPDRPPHVKCVRGNWYWDPPDRLRKSHGLTTKALGKNTVTAWAFARQLNRDHLQLGPGAPAPGSVAWLYEAFLASERFQQLADKTRRDYVHVMRRVLGTLLLGGKPVGEYQARAIRPRHADGIYALLEAQRGHHTAHYVCRVARRIWHWGARRDLVDGAANPWQGMELRSLPERTQMWTPVQVQALCAKAIERGATSIALATLLSYWLSHREGDVLRLTWAELDAMRVRTRKTRVELPVDLAAYPELQAAVETERARQKAAAVASTHVVVCEATRAPWKEFSFQHAFRDVARAAGIPDDLQFRDLRATAVTELYDSGVGDIPASTHSGHETARMRRRYARRTVEQFQNAAAARVAHLAVVKGKGGWD